MGIKTYLQKDKKKKITFLTVLVVIGVFLVKWGMGYILTTKTDDYRYGDMRSKYIAVVITNKSDATFTIPKEFREGFGDNPPFKSVESEQTIRFEKMDDLLLACPCF
ncbi:MAG: hypothetical protein ACYTBV_12910 [Planctomycetota bacterium]|jgi:hypothetical protein